MEAFFTLLQEILNQYGWVGVLAALFLMYDYRNRRRLEKREAAQDEDEKREKAQLVSRLQKVEDYQKEKLEKLLVQTTTALQNTADASRQMSDASNATTVTMKQLIIAVRGVRCLADSVDNIERGAS